MKLLFLGFTKISYMPYMRIYLDSLDGDSTVDLVYWNRDGRPDSPLPPEIRRAYLYEGRVEETWGIGRKLTKFAGYRRLALRAMSSEDYDLIVVLHSTPGLTVADRLLRKYKGRYILDYRDLSHENISFYRRLVGRLVESSRLTFVSSRGYLKYLPDSDKIRISHNLLTDSLSYREVRSSLPRPHSPLRLRYWGLIRHADTNLKLIRALANDGRFELHYHGREQDDARLMKSVCKAEGIENVFFHGEYLPAERNSFAAKTDILLNCYDNDRITVDATGNKYYDGLIYRLPQLCTDGSIMAEMCRTAGVGLPLAPDAPNLGDIIFDYYASIDWPTFDAATDTALSAILDEYYAGREEIKEELRVKS